MASCLYFIMTSWLSHFFPLTQTFPNPAKPKPINHKATNVKSTVKRANAKRTNFRRANIKRAHLKRTNFKRTNLQRASSPQLGSSLGSASSASFSSRSDSYFDHNDNSQHDFEPGPEVFPVLNSTYRSTFELLRCLPPPFHILNVLPVLPTRMSSMYELSATLPHKVTNPLVC